MRYVNSSSLLFDGVLELFLKQRLEISPIAYPADAGQGSARERDTSGFCRSPVKTQPLLCRQALNDAIEYM
jgi:hypothetical protein